MRSRDYFLCGARCAHVYRCNRGLYWRQLQRFAEAAGHARCVFTGKQPRFDLVVGLGYDHAHVPQCACMRAVIYFIECYAYAYVHVYYL